MVVILKKICASMSPNEKLTISRAQMHRADSIPRDASRREMQSNILIIVTKVHARILQCHARCLRSSNISTNLILISLEMQVSLSRRS